MAKRGGKNRLKRLAAPLTYKLPRKYYKWVINVVPGPHSRDMAVPVGVFLRDILGIAKNLREVKYILRKGYVKVDHKNVIDYKYPIGLMDIVELVVTRRFFRILPGKSSPLEPHEITGKNEYYIKPLLVKNKVMISGGRIQLTSHDGRNFVLDTEDKLSLIKPGDTIIYDFKKRRIKDYIRFERNTLALVYWGSKRGFVGRVREIRKPNPLKPKVVTLEADGEVIETTFKYVFPIGIETPVIDLGGVEIE